MSSIREAFDATDAALVPYITAGDPTPDATAAQVHALAAGGADVIELGLPFSEPIADGPTIQNAIQRSLDAGMTPDRFFEVVSGLDVEVPLVCMTYYNLIYQYGSTEGVESFVETAAEAGIAGLIVPDLPVEESDSLKQACETHELDLIFIVAPTTRGERLDHVMEQVSGFVYVQARLGTTGAQADVSEQTHDSLSRLAESDVPRAVGFGVSEGEHAREIVAAGAEGVVAGSVFVELIAEHGVESADALEEKTRELKEGARSGIEQHSPRPERT